MKKLMKKIIKTDLAPRPIGPYNQAVIAERFLFTAGQIAIEPQTGEFIAGDIKEQTRLVLQNISAILAEAKASLDQVVKTTIFLKNINDFSGMNEVYSEFFSKNFPAKSTVEVARLPKDALVEIECMAIIS
jgi:2-iminobutanoate/2-iminopropanoate deaminase